VSPHRDAQIPDRMRSGIWVVPEQRRSPSPRPVGGRICDDPDVQVPGTIYAWLVYDIDPRTGLLLPPDPITGERRTRLDYVGQTIRPLQVRAGEHLEDKPWADIVVGTLPVIVAQGLWTKQQRDDAEVAAIKRIRPRYNHDDNLGNDERIEIYRQVDQRHARDRAAGRQLWLPIDQRSIAAQVAAERALVQGGLDGNEPRYPLTVLAEWSLKLGRRLRRLPRRVQLAALALLGWAAAVWTGMSWLLSQGWPRPYALAFALVAATVAAIMAVRTKRIRRWARRKRRRR
jgi:hypothetical protein